MMNGINELMQPSFQLEPLLTPLVDRLVHLLNNVHIQSRSETHSRASSTIVCFTKNVIVSCRFVHSNVFSSCADSEYFRESIRHEIRMARERFSGQALSEELGRIQKRLDSVELLTPDIVTNLLLSYRDNQVCVYVIDCTVYVCILVNALTWGVYKLMGYNRLLFYFFSHLSNYLV